LAQLKATNVVPAPDKDLTPQEAFARFGSAEWDSIRGRYREDSEAPARAGAGRGSSK
jgi:hypothetical protein